MLLNGNIIWPFLHLAFFINSDPTPTLETSPMDKSEVEYDMNNCATTAVIVGVVCSVVFLAVGVVLGVMGLYLIQRVRGRLSGPTSSSPPPLPPPVTYEEVGVSREVKRSQDIQLTSNEAYGPIQKNNIQTSPNTAYEQVNM